MGCLGRLVGQVLFLIFALVVLALYINYNGHL